MGLTGPRAASSAEPPKWPAHAHRHAFGLLFCASFLQSKPPSVLICHCLAPSQWQDQLYVTLTLHQHILMYVLSPLGDCNPREVAIRGRITWWFFIFLVAKGQSRLQGILVCVPVQMYMNLTCKGEGFWMTGLVDKFWSNRIYRCSESNCILYLDKGRRDMTSILRSKTEKE